MTSSRPSSAAKPSPVQPEQVATQPCAYEEVGVEQLISRIGSDGSFGSGTESWPILTEVWPSVSP